MLNLNASRKSHPEFDPVDHSAEPILVKIHVRHHGDLSAKARLRVL